MTDGRRNPRTNLPTTVPGIPKPPSDISSGLQRYLTNLSEALEIRLGRKGDPRDRAVTLRELIDSGLAKELANAPFDPNNPGGDFGTNEDLANLAVPPAPLGFTADGGYSVVILSWDLPLYSNHSLTEIWRHTSDVLGDALLVGTQIGTVYIDPVGESADYYYWARHVNTNNVAGPFNGTSGSQATTATNTATLLEELEASIPAVAFAAGIEPVGVVNTLPNVSGYTGPTIVVLTTDGKLYRLVNGAWTAAVPTVDLTGTISELQIAADAVTNAKIAVNAIQGDVIAASAITETKVSSNAISAAKIRAGAVIAGKIATNAVTANTIEAGAVIAEKIDAGAVTAAKIDAGAVTAVKIDAGAVTANKIDAGAITADKIDAGAVTAGAIAAGAINAQNIIADGVIIGDKIAGNTIQADKIVAGSIAADRLATGSVTAAKVNTNEIITFAANIADAVITTAKIQNASITSAKIGTAQVDTLRIAGNAVTVPDSDYGSVGSRTLTSSSYVTIAEVSNYNIPGFNNIAASLTVTGGVSISGNSAASNLCLISLWSGTNKILEHGITVDGFGSYYGVVAREFPVYNYTNDLSVKIRAYSTSKAISSAQGWVTVMGTQR